MRTLALSIGALCGGFAAAAFAQATSGPYADLAALAHPFFTFTAAGSAGILWHGCSKWLKKEIDGNLIDYFFRDHGRASIAAITSFIGTAATAAYMHGLDGLTMTQLLWIGFATGLGFDSQVNKSTPKPAAAVPAPGDGP